MRLSRDSLTTRSMERYIIPLLLYTQCGNCTKCGGALDDYQVHHKRYAEDITIDDLELIHGHCHASEHGLRGVKGKERALELGDKVKGVLKSS